MGCNIRIKDTKGGSGRVAKFLQQSILIAFDFYIESIFLR